MSFFLCGIFDHIWPNMNKNVEEKKNSYGVDWFCPSSKKNLKPFTLLEILCRLLLSVAPGGRRMRSIKSILNSHKEQNESKARRHKLELCHERISSLRAIYLRRK